MEILADDDFEATVFEEAPQSPAIDTAVHKLDEIDDGLSGAISSEAVIAPPAPDETMERISVAPRSGNNDFTSSGIVAAPAPSDDWVVTGLSAAVRALEEDANGGHDGTPIEGVIAAAPALPVIDGSFVAGEIDIPTPPPKLLEKKPRGESQDTPAVEFTAASGLLGSDPEPDTGSRTPPLERR